MAKDNNKLPKKIDRSNYDNEADFLIASKYYNEQLDLLNNQRNKACQSYAKSISERIPNVVQLIQNITSKGKKISAKSVKNVIILLVHKESKFK